MPAEWEPHRAMWLAMPHDEEEWGPYFGDARDAVRKLANMIAESETVMLLVSNREDRVGLHDNIVCHDIPYGDIWLRDTGPIFVETDAGIGGVGFAFNGWGGKYLFEHDQAVAGRIADLAAVPLTSSPLVAEGGSLDGNGQGTFLSTRQCLLNDNRNPGKTEAEVERALEHAVGCKKLIWLDHGLAGDHTDGHVDNIARFVGPSTVVCMEPAGRDDPNAEVLEEIQLALANARTFEGTPLDVVAIPSPGRVEGPAGVMAASYCNFLVANDVVVVPTFGVAADEAALRALSSLFPKRTILPLDAYALLTGGGTVHCISQQEPQHV